MVHVQFGLIINRKLFNLLPTGSIGWVRFPTKPNQMQLKLATLPVRKSFKGNTLVYGMLFSTVGIMWILALVLEGDMFRLEAQLTFLSRVLRPVVVVAVAHKLHAERPACYRNKNDKNCSKSCNHNAEQHPTRFLFSAESPSYSVLGFWSAIIRYISTFSFIRWKFFFWLFPRWFLLLLLLFLWTRQQL